MKILLVEDNAPLRATLKEALCEEGYLVEAVADGEEGCYRASNFEYDVVVLDVMLPGMNGWEILEKLRAKNLEVPVLMLTARDSAQDRVRGLDAGADDYLVKPFTLMELCARIRALLRRRGGSRSPVITVGDVTLDTGKKEVRKGGEVVDLTALEYRMVDSLITQRGKVVSRSYLFEHLFAEEKEVVSNILEVYVCNVRKKLGAQFVKTKRGHGYYIDEAS
ncbi:response regulator transcription factor [Rubritalea spongiae]|uniref:Response regulator transcription factor n=1 Tax=Rubritalea spongiae TaxID=430797 RepID=A0ABW5E0C1_9BACT